ncbi:hypothetical protein [Methanofollis ethanolicus]|uniref:hypothetical protein n=1 Tax=Methanofollis ethanolicus TaxID=488124 RepID=UPI00128FC2B3|nr:hypothetical protein [Methanofollis ethanolicus]
MPCDDRIDGSLHDSPCANTGSRKTATTTSASAVLSASNGVHTTGPVPLYLIVPTVMAEVKRLHVSIPYARRVHFSATTNRRNPGIFFDLIKACALLHRFEREDYGGGIRADRSDFETAARIYAAINSDAGGQETKLTKNEAAAIKTVEAMGWSVFTIRMLQDALGLSYQQTYRILHGYASRGTIYSGLLEKCPAVSYLDTTVSSDVDGYLVRRREHLFSFDPEAYRRWTAGAHVWLDRDPPDDDTFAPGMHRDGTEDVQRTGTEGRPRSTYSREKRERSLSHSTLLHQTEGAHTTPDPRVAAGVCVCAIRVQVNTGEGGWPRRPRSKITSRIAPRLVATRKCRAVQSGAAVQTGPGWCPCRACYARLVRAWNGGRGIA